MPTGPVLSWAAPTQSVPRPRAVPGGVLSSPTSCPKAPLAGPFLVRGWCFSLGLITRVAPYKNAVWGISGPACPPGVEGLPAEETYSAGPANGDGVHWHGKPPPHLRQGLGVSQSMGSPPLFFVPLCPRTAPHCPRLPPLRTVFSKSGGVQVWGSGFGKEWEGPESQHRAPSFCTLPL